MASIKRHWSQPDRKPFDKSLLTPNNPRAHPDLRVKDRSNLQEIRTRVRALRDELEIMKKRGKMCIEEIGYDFDKERLLDEALEHDGYEAFVDPKTKRVVKEWLIKRNVDNYAKTINQRLRNDTRDESKAEVLRTDQGVHRTVASGQRNSERHQLRVDDFSRSYRVSSQSLQIQNGDNRRSAGASGYSHHRGQSAV